MRILGCAMCTVSLGILLSTLAPCPVWSECIDYGDHLRWVDEIDMPGDWSANYAAIATSGSYAYVAYGPWGLHIIDLADSLHPRIVGSLQTIMEARDVAVSGPYAFVATWVEPYQSGILVVDVSNPEAPAVAGSVITSDAYSVTVAGTYAYVADDGAGLKVVDISDPRNPVVVGHADTGYSYDVAVSGSYAYVVGDGHFAVVDISDPTDPRVLAGLDRPRFIWKVAVSGSHVYLAEAAADAGDILVVDVADPASPQVVSELAVPDVPQGLMISGRFAYVANGPGGLTVVDIANPANPHLMGTEFAGCAMDLSVIGRYAYVVDANLKFQVIDVTHPEAPPILGKWPTDIVAVDVAIAGRYAYVAEVSYWPQGGALQIIDVEDPRNPRSVGVVDTPGWATDVVVSGDYAYVADGYLGNEGAGLQIVDVRDPESPRVVGGLQMGGACHVAISGDYAYVPWGSHGFTVVDVADPLDPQIVGTAALGGFAADVALAGRFACVAEYNAGIPMQTIDVSDPRNPQVAGTVFTEGSFDLEDAGAIAVSGGQAYLGGPVKLRVADVSDCQSPAVVGRVHLGGLTPGLPCGLAAAAGTVYLPGTGLRVIDVRDPRRPRMIGGSWVGWGAGVAVSDSYVYVAALESGLYILPTQCGSEAGVEAGGSNIPDSQPLAFPNPAQSGAMIHLSLPATGHVRIEIHDPTGRLVRNMVDGVPGSDLRDLVWDGRDDTGRLVPAGLYLIRGSSGSGTSAGRVIILR